MVTAARTPRRDRIAIGISIAVHLCVLASLAALPRASFPTSDPDERSLLSSLIRIEHRPTPPPRIAHQALAAQAAPAPRLAPPVIHAAVTVERASHKMIVAEEHRAGTARAPDAVRKHLPEAAPAVQVASAAEPGAAAAAAPAAAPTALPTAAPAPSPAAAQRDEGIGNFGESYPASIDPRSRAPLFAGVNNFVVRISVDENGRATSIEFVRAPADAALRDELRTRLLAAHFIPAACNGLRCAGTVELRN